MEKTYKYPGKEHWIQVVDLFGMELTRGYRLEIVKDEVSGLQMMSGSEARQCS